MQIILRQIFHTWANQNLVIHILCHIGLNLFASSFLTKETKYHGFCDIISRNFKLDFPLGSLNFYILVAKNSVRRTLNDYKG